MGLFKDTTFRIFFATDIHGSEIVWKKFLNSIKVYNAHLLIFGGDITGKAIVPIVKNDTGYVSTIYGNETKLRNDNELKDFIQLQKNKGFYPIVLGKEEYAEMQNNEKLREEKFKELMLERLEQWLNLAEERLKGTGVKLLWEPGNDDPLEIDTRFKDSENVINMAEKVIEINNFYIVGLSYANTTPWNLPRDAPEEKIDEIIKNTLRSKGLDSTSRDNRDVIFAFHPPPYGTNLDLAPKVLENFTYAKVGGQPDFINVGSKSVRKAIEEYQPLLGLHGHIHESRGVEKIKNTVCVNPGSEYQEAILHGALINLDGKRVKGYVLTTG
ncbi:MAG: metallophosphoesterase family protein [Thermoplasmata archaeon]|jgi:Icc-related predicted phosphoesterase|nr:MAG: metallophosphoesterase [Aciduliprofundum sp.]